MHNSYDEFYATVFCLLSVFRTNLVVHHQEHSIIYCVCNTVYYVVLQMMNQIRSKHVEQTKKNCGVKLIIRMCISSVINTFWEEFGKWRCNSIHLNLDSEWRVCRIRGRLSGCLICEVKNLCPSQESNPILQLSSL